MVNYPVLYAMNNLILPVLCISTSISTRTKDLPVRTVTSLTLLRVNSWQPIVANTSKLRVVSRNVKMHDGIMHKCHAKKDCTYQNADNVRAHEKTHTGKNYGCDKCSETFQYWMQMDRHMSK